MSWLLIFLYYIPGEVQPERESSWWKEQVACETRVQAMRDSAMEAGIIVYFAECREEAAP